MLIGCSMQNLVTERGSSLPASAYLDREHSPIHVAVVVLFDGSMESLVQQANAIMQDVGEPDQQWQTVPSLNHILDHLVQINALGIITVTARGVHLKEHICEER